MKVLYSNNHYIEMETDERESLGLYAMMFEPHLVVLGQKEMVAHLSREEAGMIAGLLQAFADTGEFAAHRAAESEGE